ncbi:hypothetical protein NDU88_000129, partial [Pleurodeles waltl]
ERSSKETSASRCGQGGSSQCFVHLLATFHLDLEGEASLFNCNPCCIYHWILSFFVRKQ